MRDKMRVETREKPREKVRVRMRDGMREFSLDNFLEKMRVICDKSAGEVRVMCVYTSSHSACTGNGQQGIIYGILLR